jgi:hypothetical protein
MSRSYRSPPASRTAPPCPCWVRRTVILGTVPRIVAARSGMSRSSSIVAVTFTIRYFHFNVNLPGSEYYSGNPVDNQPPIPLFALAVARNGHQSTQSPNQEKCQVTGDRLRAVQANIAVTTKWGFDVLLTSAFITFSNSSPPEVGRGTARMNEIEPHRIKSNMTSLKLGMCNDPAEVTPSRGRGS